MVYYRINLRWQVDYGYEKYFLSGYAFLGGIRNERLFYQVVRSNNA